MIAGKVVGDVSATERVELLPSGSLEGNIRAPKIVIAEGAQFKGSVDMGGRPGPDDDAAGAARAERRAAKGPPMKATSPSTGNWIGGEWVPARSGKLFENRNPADVTDLIGRFAGLRRTRREGRRRRRGRGLQELAPRARARSAARSSTASARSCATARRSTRAT